MFTCFQINPQDNTAVMLGDGEANAIIQVIGAGHVTTVQLTQAIAYGHKVALADLEVRAAVIKYGIPIGHATQPIRAGDWVHLHNCASDYDARSATLDGIDGKPTDTVYA